MLKEATQVDRRVRRTKKMLKMAFINLMQEKDYQRITVKDIVEKADYNRATFYLHYRYKEQLVAEIVEDMINGLINTTLHPYYITCYPTPPFVHTNLILFDYILENKNFFKLLDYSHRIPGFIEKFINTIKKVLRDEMTNEGLRNKSDNFVSFLAYGIFGLIINWVKSDFAVSPHYMSKQLVDILRSVENT